MDSIVTGLGLFDEIEADFHRKVLTDTFGENPCRRNVFANIDTSEVIETFCDSPRCDDCGPRKAYRLWYGVEEKLVGAVTLVKIDEDDEQQYKATIGLIRQRRSRRNIDCHYISWVDAGERYILTDAPDIDGRRVLAEQYRKRVVALYQTGRAYLRKSLDLARVSLRSVTRSLMKRGRGVTPWRYMKKKFATSRDQQRYIADSQNAIVMKSLGMDGWQVWEDEHGRLRSSIQPFGDTVVAFR